MGYRLILLLWCILHDDRMVLAQPIGCYSYNYLFLPTMSSNLTVGDPRECQARCRKSAGCKHFSYWKRNGMCLLAAAQANLLRSAVEGSVTGPDACMPTDPVCSAIPGPGFPGETESMSRSAWEGGQQPTNLQCWPRRADGFPMACKYQQVTVLEDTMKGWPGRCENMKKVTDLRPGETCKMRCYTSALCGVWSVVNSTTGLGGPICLQAMHGINCYKGTGPLPIRAQRVMHGSFRKLIETMGMLVKNLTKAFDTTDVGNNDDEGAERCRRVCLSYLFCQYWQYSTKLGCWVEDPAAKEVAYPMVEQTWAMETETADANTVRMGEYIQHTCNVGERIPLPTDAAGSLVPVRSPIGGTTVQPVGSSDPQTHSREPNRDTQPKSPPEESHEMPLGLKVFIVFIIALCLAGVAGAVYMLVMGRKKGTRGVSGGSKKSGSSRRSQRQESPSVGNLGYGGGDPNYGEPTAWQQGETVPFMQNQGGQQRGNYGNSFPQPQQGYMPTQPQMYQPMQQHGYGNM